LVIAAVVIIASTYAVGKDSTCIHVCCSFELNWLLDRQMLARCVVQVNYLGYLQFNNTTELQDDDVPYGYGFFHLVFALGAMYIGMLFVGWNAHKTMEK
jgi:hypothetical protein